MAKVTLNPMLDSLNGNIGNIVFYQRWKRMYARIYVTPDNPDTEKQRANRALFRNAMNEWKLLSTEEKHRYNKRARRLPMTGQNLFISEYMKKHLAERCIEKSQAETEKCQKVFSSCSASAQRAVPSVIPPSRLLYGLYTAPDPDINCNSHG